MIPRSPFLDRPFPTSATRLFQRLIFGLWMVCTAATTLPAEAGILRVDGSVGTDSGNCGTIESPCATIQQAVDLAASDDVVLVAEGVYVDNVSCFGDAAVVCVYQKEVSILGGYASGNWSSADPHLNVTVIDGQDARRGVLVRRGGPDSGLPDTGLRLQGFTVRHGRALGDPQGVGGGLKANFADVTLRDVIFDDNLAEGGSGGLGGGGGAAILSDSDNIAEVVLNRVVFTANRAIGGAGSGGPAVGGALLVDHAIVSSLDVTLDGNFADGGSSGTDGLDSLGGGAAFSFGSSGTLRAWTVTNNTATGGSGSATGRGAFGGGVYLEGGDGSTKAVTDLTILDSTFTGNVAQGGNGADDAGGGVGGGINVFAARLTLERGRLIGNLARGGLQNSGRANAGGGGIFFEWPFGSGDPLNVVRNSVVAENDMEGSQGGGSGIRLLGARADVIHTTLFGNRIVGIGFGSGILVGPRLTEPSTLDLDFSILSEHDTGRALHVQETVNAGSTADLSDRNFFVGNTLDSNHGRPNSGTFVGYPGDNLFDTGPADFFVDPATSDFNVDGSEPPSNSAPGSSEPLDLDGASRTGTRDLGADEFGAVAYLLRAGTFGSGEGAVSSSPAGINCGVDCAEAYASGTAVELIATPASGSGFSGWSGDADCSDGEVTMDADRHCSAQFDADGAGACTADEDELFLTGGQTVNSTVIETACVRITAGPYVVGLDGDVTFESPEIVLQPGFEVRGTFAVISSVP